MHPWLRAVAVHLQATFQSHWLAGVLLQIDNQHAACTDTLRVLHDPCNPVIHCTRLYLDVCAKGMQATMYSLGSGAHMLASLQDIMKAPGGSATELLPSTSSRQDEAPMLHQQPSEDAPVLQGDILPRAQVCSNPV